MVGQRKSEAVFLKGKFKYMCHLKPNPRYPDKWNTLFYPADDTEIAKIKDLKKRGVQNHLKMDDDGWFINFSRPIEAPWGGAMLPPKVIFKDGTPCEVRVGNGSDGILELDVYQHKTDRVGEFKAAARWAGARIDNFISFNPETEYPEEDKETIKKLREEPEQLF